MPQVSNAKTFFNQMQVTEWLDPVSFNLIVIWANQLQLILFFHFPLLSKIGNGYDPEGWFHVIIKPPLSINKLDDGALNYPNWSTLLEIALSPHRAQEQGEWHGSGATVERNKEEKLETSMSFCSSCNINECCIIEKRKASNRKSLWCS